MPTPSFPRRSGSVIRWPERDPRVLPVALAGLLLVLVWGLVGLLVYLQYSDADRASTHRAQALTRMLSPQVEARIAGLEALADTLLERSGPEIGEQGLQRLVDETGMPQEVLQVSLLDGQGQVIARVMTPGALKSGQPLRIEAQGKPMKHPGGIRVVVEADASRLMALAAGAPFNLEGTALLARDDGQVLGAYPDTGQIQTTQDAASTTWPAGTDGLERHWAASAIPQQGLQLQVAVTNDGLYDDLRRRTTLIVAAAAIESGVAIALAMLVLGQTRRRDRLLRRLDIGRRRLRQANLAKTRFLESISHELRTPLNGIVCTSELMVQLALNDEQAEVADIISQSASELAAMIDMLIDIAELQSGNALVTETRTDIREIIETASQSSLSSLWGRGGSLTLRWAPDLSPGILVDPVRFARIVKTLIDAAGNVYARPAVALVAGPAGPDRLSLKVSVSPASSNDTELPAPPAFRQAAGRIPGDTRADTEDLKAALGLLLLQDLVTTLGGGLSVGVPGTHEHVIEIHLPIHTAEEAVR